MKLVKCIRPISIHFITKITWRVVGIELPLSSCTWQVPRRWRDCFQMLRPTLNFDLTVFLLKIELWDYPGKHLAMRLLLLSFENKVLWLLQLFCCNLSGLGVRTCLFTLRLYNLAYIILFSFYFFSLDFLWYLLTRHAISLRWSTNSLDYNLAILYNLTS